MSALRLGDSNAAEMNTDEGDRLIEEDASQQVDGTKASATDLGEHAVDVHDDLDTSMIPKVYSEERGQMEIFRTPEVNDILVWYSREQKDVWFDVLRCSWDDVFGQIARARNDHEAAVSKKGNLFKYLWRKAGSEKEAIEPWLQLFPDEYGLSIVRASICILFHMAEKTHQREKSILDGFETITEIIHSAMSKGVSYYTVPEMYACCQALQDSIITGVAELIWLLKGDEGKGKNKLEKFRDKHNKKKSMNIEALVKKVQTKSTELDQCAARIQAEMTFKTNQNVSTLMMGVVDLSIKQEHQTRAIDLLGRDITKLQEGLQQVQDAVKDNSPERTAILVKDVFSALMDYHAQSFCQFLREAQEQNREMILEQQRVLRAMTSTPHTKVVHLQRIDLLEWLDVPYPTVNEDLHNVATVSVKYDRKLQEQAQAVIRTDKYRHWLMSSYSQILLVDGNISSTTRSTVSPMSTLCAMLPMGLNAVLGSENFIVLHYFAGLHKSRNDQLGGTHGMARALVHELACAVMRMTEGQETFAMAELQKVSERRFVEDLQDHRLRALMLAFKNLLLLIPRHITVICLVDGVTHLEANDDDAEDLAYVVQQFEKIVEANKRTIKFLFTCAYRSTFLVRERLIHPGDYLRANTGGSSSPTTMTEQSMTHWSRH